MHVVVEMIDLPNDGYDLVIQGVIVISEVKIEARDKIEGVVVLRFKWTSLFLALGPSPFPTPHIARHGSVLPVSL